jgi:NitT/TauT family transport system ATP-binding protein
MTRLSLRGISKRFQGRAGEVLALEDIWLDIEPGQLCVLVGPSGCGKSTILNIIAGLERADRGEVLEDGVPVAGPGRDRSVVFQEGALFPWLTARRNVEFGLKQMGIRRTERKELADHYLHLVHLTRFGDSFIHELSGGMRQRVALARALALEPRVLLMDEPFAALDAQTRQDLYVVLQEIWERTGQTIVFVTHNVREAAVLGDRVIVMSARPGTVKADYPIQLARPRSIDNIDITRMSQMISQALRDDIARGRLEEYDLDWKPAEDGILRGADSVLGDHI